MDPGIGLFRLDFKEIIIGMLKVFKGKDTCPNVRIIRYYVTEQQYD